MMARALLAPVAALGLTLAASACARPTEAQCNEVADKIKALVLAELGDVGQAGIDRASTSFEKTGREKILKTCAESGSAKDIECILAAKSLADLAACS